MGLIGKCRFQMVSLLKLARVTEEGVRFLSPHDGSPMYVLQYCWYGSGELAKKKRPGCLHLSTPSPCKTR